jgi:hypothetical protein
MRLRRALAVLLLASVAQMVGVALYLQQQNKVVSVAILTSSTGSYNSFRLCPVFCFFCVVDCCLKRTVDFAHACKLLCWRRFGSVSRFYLD